MSQTSAIRHSISCAILAISATLAVLGTAFAQSADLKAFDGEWIFVDDKTEGRSLEQFNPPMNSRFIFKVEDGAIVLVWGHGGNGNRNVRIPVDGSNVDVLGEAGATVRYRATLKDGLLAYEMEFSRGAGQPFEAPRKREFRMTKDGLVVRSDLELTPGVWSVGLYKKPADIPMPAPFKATIADLSWLTGNWAGTRGSTNQIAFEERWGPAKGGSMFAISRTVNRDRLSAFEYLRIVEKDGGLVYVAQPNGGTATEFVMTELTKTRAVFDNPRHDYPKRIVYELTEGGLTATIGYLKGGAPRKFEFKKETG